MERLERWHDLAWPLVRDCSLSCVVDVANDSDGANVELREVAKTVCVVHDGNGGLQKLQDGAASLILCMDTMVRSDSDRVRTFLAEVRRTLQRDGHAICRHSNDTSHPGDAESGRPPYMSQGLFAHYAAKERLDVVTSQVIDADGEAVECLTLLRQPTFWQELRRGPWSLKEFLRCTRRAVRKPRRSHTRPALSDDAGLVKTAGEVGADWRYDPYYKEAENFMDEQWETVVWPFIQDSDFTAVVDLAAGRGRNSAKLGDVVAQDGLIYVVDINIENVEACRSRFCGDPRFHFLHNNGVTMAGIADGEVSLVYCFDAMVHFDSDIVRSYLREMARVLRPGGRGFCHHSNYDKNPAGKIRDNLGSRNFMSESLFAHYAAKEGLFVVRSKVIDWFEPESDCLTLVEKPS